MGTCYYLIREDDVVYDLGKAYGWGALFGESPTGVYAPMALRPEDADTLAELLEQHLLADGWWKREDTDRIPGYLKRVCQDIADWSAGKAFVFVSEHSAQLERIEMRTYDEWVNGGRVGEQRDDKEEWMTGSRFTGEMERLAAARHGGTA